ncbi:16S rRNA processing protein RimM [Paratractidigestivibacter sp.]|uniref:ribosome maturation factor RimM n=1 Tax=Paratractidigestivibacter sp. TaxID=2847316 RepID=UPI002ABE95B0|nr:16S rRNA processing protein RimM [Paratractidigestivibacter sp.]
MRERYRCIARVQKSHGKIGEVVAVPVHGLPAVLAEGLDVCVVPPRLKGERWKTVESCFEDNREGSLIHLSGVDGIDEAKALVGRYLLARESDLPDDIDLHDVDRLLGREVADERLGLSGRITEVMRGVANDVWVIDAGGEELLLPVIERVVMEVPEQGAITVDAEGFYGLEGR